MTNICFIGLGNMGLPMATNLVNAGHKVTGIDLSEAAKSAFADIGGKIAETIEQGVEEADVVITMLPSGKHVKSIYEGEKGVFASSKSKALLIDCSTIDVETSRQVSTNAQSNGMMMIDAPVSGGVGGAAAGTLTFMVGGSEVAFNMASPYLDIMGKTIIHAGESGAGQAAKICNNMLLGISMIGVCEAFALAEKLGLDQQRLFDISSTASGQCWSLTTYCPVPGPVPTSPANRDYQAGFSAAMMLKDLKLAQEAAHSADASTPLGAAAEALYQLYAGQGHGEKDFSGIIQMLKGQEKA